MKPSYSTASDKELVKILAEIDPMSPNLSDLLVEMWQRELPEATRYGKALMAGNRDGNLNRHPDTRLYDVLEVLCSCLEAQLSPEGWINLVYGYERRILDTLMIIANRKDSAFAGEVFNLAANQESCVLNKAARSIATVIPTDNVYLEEILLRLAQNKRIMPNTRVAVFDRLASLPWSRDVEDFFVSFCIADDGSDVRLTDIVSSALRKVE